MGKILSIVCSTLASGGVFGAGSLKDYVGERARIALGMGLSATTAQSPHTHIWRHRSDKQPRFGLFSARNPPNGCNRSQQRFRAS